MSATGSHPPRPVYRLAQGQVTDREGLAACSAAFPPRVTNLDGLPGSG